ncbi:MAG: hypothetical protein QW660_07825 [Candidatus Bathyarchaeia archaeon]
MKNETKDEKKGTRTRGIKPGLGPTNHLHLIFKLQQLPLPNPTPNFQTNENNLTIVRVQTCGPKATGIF